MQVLRAADRLASPWKNGGGVTHEVAVWPEGAGFDDFGWRVSLAEVLSDGPFSMFPEVDRILTVLEGRLHLAVEGREEVELTAASAPYAFAGDAPAAGQVAGGRVRDLNVMTRRGVVSATVVRLQISGELYLAATATPRILIAGGPMQLAGAEPIALAGEDAVVFAAGDRPNPVAADHVRACLVTLRPLAGVST